MIAQHYARHWCMSVVLLSAFGGQYVLAKVDLGHVQCPLLRGSKCGKINWGDRICLLYRGHPPVRY